MAFIFRKTIPCFFIGTTIIACFFVPEITRSSTEHIIINEVQITGGTGKASDDFIELYNPTDKKMNLKGYRLVKRTKTGLSDTTIKSWTSDAFIKSHDYFLWANSSDGFANELSADAATSQTISNDNAVALRKGSEDTGEIIDSVGWGQNQTELVENLPYPKNPGSSESIERMGFEDTDDNSLDFFPSDSPTPSHSSKEEDDDSGEDDEKNNPGCNRDIYLSELLPNPKDEKDEYIELANRGSSDADISGWILKDASKTGKYVFPDGSKIQSHSFLVINRSEFKFSLNNSKETVTLLCGDGTEADNVQYEKSKEEISYDSDSSGNWSWSSHKTPGEKNELEKIPKLKMKIPKETYSKTYIQFESKIKNAKKYKFRWDFGDKHRSYLPDPRHKFEKAGTYVITLLARGASQDIEIRKKIKISGFPKEKAEITSFCPNPKGSDAKFEWIEIKNNSKEKIDFTGWSIASGNKKLINHPFYKKLILKAGETKKITKEFSHFSLNNKEGSVEIRYPDGKPADSIAYNHEGKAAEEDETYRKTAGHWAWLKEGNETIPEDTDQKIIAENKIDPLNNPIDDDTGKTEENDVGIGGCSEIKLDIFIPHCLSEFDNKEKIVRNSFQNKNHPRITDDSVSYAFNEKTEKPHWLKALLKKSASLTNSDFNNLISLLKRLP